MTKLQAIFKMTCPACWKGSLFVKDKNPFAFHFKMHKRCTVCNEDFEREPGFYFGSMFLSYILTGFFSFAVVGFFILVCKVSWEWAMGILALVLVALYAFIYKFSRSLWIHLMVGKKH